MKKPNSHLTGLFFTAIVFAGVLGVGKYASAATLYMGPSETYTNLQSAMAAMQSGDTLIIRDGIYTGASNQMGTYQYYPPNGAEGDYTVIKAENEGQVLFDGEGVRCMFRFNGPGTHQYLEFRGIKWANSDSSVIETYGMDHIKFFRCGASGALNSGNNHTWNITNSSYILLEECYAWGTGGRYKFVAYLSDHIIFRRCVGRNDAITTTSVLSTFMNYASQYVEFQNCIAIDCDCPEFWSGWTYLQPAFTTHEPHNGEYTEHSAWRGNIALNIASRRIFTHATDVHDLTIENCVFWHGVNNGEDTNYTNGVEGNTNVNTIFNHCTIGDLIEGATGINSWNNGNSTMGITNSIVNGCTIGVNGTSPCLYNAFDNNTANIVGTSCSNSITTENILGNALHYLVKAEDGSNLDGTASDGKDIGATVLTKIGASGTLYGDVGYNLDTEESLWPFPYEDQIEADFASYNLGGIDLTKPDGKRGFCADGNGLYGGPITLTSYIWEYLGNACPEDICNYSQSGDTTPPATPSGLSVR